MTNIFLSHRLLSINKKESELLFVIINYTLKPVGAPSEKLTHTVYHRPSARCVRM